MPAAVFNQSKECESRPAERDIVRWYVMLLPERHRGLPTALYKARSLRIDSGDEQFDFLAPTFLEKRTAGGREQWVSVPTLFNYVFVRASIATIFELKRSVLSAYNFLRPEAKGSLRFPFVSDKEMETLRWVAESYKNRIPFYSPHQSRLMQGDVVRFTSGSLQGKSAEIVSTAGGRKKEFIIRIRIEDGLGEEEFFSVPIKIDLCYCDYVVERLNIDDKQLYARLDNAKQLDETFASLIRHRQTLTTDTKAAEKARLAIRQYGSVENIPTTILRSKLFAQLLPAYRLLGRKKEYDSALSLAVSFAETIKARQARLQLFLVLFACTGEYYWRDKATKELHDQAKNKKDEQYAKWLAILSEAYSPAALRPAQHEWAHRLFPERIEKIMQTLPADSASLSEEERTAIEQLRAALNGSTELISQDGITPDSQRSTETTAMMESVNPQTIEQEFHDALVSHDASKLIALRPHLCRATYLKATNHETRTTALHILWATSGMKTSTVAEKCLKALAYLDVLRTV